MFPCSAIYFSSSVYLSPEDQTASASNVDPWPPSLRLTSVRLRRVQSSSVGSLGDGTTVTPVRPSVHRSVCPSEAERPSVLGSVQPQRSSFVLSQCARSRGVTADTQLMSAHRPSSDGPALGPGIIWLDDQRVDPGPATFMFMLGAATLLVVLDV